MFKRGEPHAPIILVFGTLKAQEMLEPETIREAGPDSFFCDTSKSVHVDHTNQSSKIGFKFESRGTFKTTGFQLTSNPMQKTNFKRFFSKQGLTKLAEGIPHFDQGQPYTI